jgi:hypothetical protein
VETSSWESGDGNREGGDPLHPGRRAAPKGPPDERRERSERSEGSALPLIVALHAAHVAAHLVQAAAHSRVQAAAHLVQAVALSKRRKGGPP